MGLLWWINLRYLTRHRRQTALAVCGIALGVAVVTAVQLMQAAARESFNLSQGFSVGRATHRVVAIGEPLRAASYRALLDALPDLAASPAIELEVARDADQLPSLRVVGIEPFSALNGHARWQDERYRALATNTSIAYASDATLHALALSPGDTLTLPTPRHVQLTLARGDGLEAIPEGVIVTDVAVARAMQDEDMLAHIDIALTNKSTIDETLATIRSVLGNQVDVRDLARDRAYRRGLTTAFDINLTALSLLALLMGLFLVANTEHFLVVQRFDLLRRLRTLGVTRVELAGGILAEAATLGALGSALGVLLGTLLARQALGAVQLTLNEFYFAMTQSEVNLRPATILWLWSGGIVCTLGAALAPALHAARIPLLGHPDSFARPARAGSRCRLALLALLIGGTAWALTTSGGVGRLWFDFGLLAGWLLLGISVVPPGIRLLAHALARSLSLSRWWPEQLGAATVARFARRSGFAAAALCAAAALALGMQTMITSFRAAVDDWLQRLLQADVYVAADPKRARTHVLEDFVKKVEDHPSIVAISRVARTEAYSAGAPVLLSVYALPTRAERGFQFIGSSSPAWDAWRKPDQVFISEAFANRYQKNLGDSIAFDSPRGVREFTIAGVYRDYASERGIVAMSWETYLRHWPTPAVDGLGVYLREAEPRAKTQAIKQLRARFPMLSFQSKQELKARSLRIFDRTFEITRLIGALALVTAFIGIVGALLAQQIERAGDYALLHALGARAREVLRLALAHTLQLGVVAALCALPLGIGIAGFLVRVINLHAFGWRIPLTVDGLQMAWVFIGVLIAALAAALYPAYRHMRLAPRQALQAE